MKTKEIFISDSSIANDFVKQYEYPYQVLKHIKEYIIELGNSLNEDYHKSGENIWIHKDAKVNKTAEIHGPCIIDANAEIRCNAFIRGNVIIGKNTNGTVIAGGYEYKVEIINTNNKFYFQSMTNKYDTSIMEGIGFIPDIWANNELDVFKNIWNITNDYEIKTKDYSRIIDHDNYKWYENKKSWNY